MENNENEFIIPENVRLEIIEGPDQGKEFFISNKTVTIGRDSTCNFVLTDEYLSNKHCQIVFRGDHFTIIDLQSTNKTIVNDKDFLQKNLKNNDIITLGTTKICFHLPE